MSVFSSDVGVAVLSDLLLYAVGGHDGQSYI
jgi:hypothetical protein